MYANLYQQMVCLVETPDIPFVGNLTASVSVYTGLQLKNILPQLRLYFAFRSNCQYKRIYENIPFATFS